MLPQYFQSIKIINWKNNTQISKIYQLKNNKNNKNNGNK